MSKIKVECEDDAQITVELPEGMVFLPNLTDAVRFRLGCFCVSYKNRLMWLRIFKDGSYKLYEKKPEFREIQETEIDKSVKVVSAYEEGSFEVNESETSVSNENTDLIDPTSEEGKELMEKKAKEIERVMKAKAALKTKPVEVTVEDVETAQKILSDLRSKCVELSGSSAFDKASLNECVEFLKRHENELKTEIEPENKPVGVAPLNKTVGGEPLKTTQKVYDDFKSMYLDVEAKAKAGDKNSQKILDYWLYKMFDEIAKKRRSPEIHITQEGSLREEIEKKKRLERIAKLLGEGE